MDPLQGSLQYLKGVGPRRAADLQRAGLATVEDLLYRFPTRYEDRGHFQTIASLKPGVVRVGARRSAQLRHPSDAPAALQDLRDAAARPDRQPARRLVQPAVPERRLPSAPARHPLRQARADVARPADAGPAVRDSRRRARPRRRRRTDAGDADGDGSHRTDRSRLREDRAADREDAADAGAPGAAGHAGGSCRIRCRAAVRAAAEADRSARRARAGALSAAGRVDRRAQRVSIAGAPAADLRGVLPLPARDRPARAPRRRRAQGTRRRRHRRDRARRCGGCCRSS